MILSIDLLNRNTHGVSWLPLYHDMGLSMIGFPAVYGGHSTLLSPTAFIRGRSAGFSAGCRVAARPRGHRRAELRIRVDRTTRHSEQGKDVNLSNVVLIIGSEPVSMDAIRTFNEAFAPYGLPPTAFKPSYGIAEATLFVSTIEPGAQATAVYLDREQLGAGQAVPSRRMPPTP